MKKPVKLTATILLRANRDEVADALRDLADCVDAYNDAQVEYDDADKEHLQDAAETRADARYDVEQALDSLAAFLAGE